MEDRDVVIIGGGPAGYTAAIRVAQLGAKATIVENDTIGGICVNHGCIPTEALARAVELLEMGKNAKDYGINYEGMKVDFPRMMSKKDAVVKTLVSGVKQMLETYRVEIIEGIGDQWFWSRAVPCKLKRTGGNPGSAFTQISREIAGNKASGCAPEPLPSGFFRGMGNLRCRKRWNLNIYGT